MGHGPGQAPARGRGTDFKGVGGTAVAAVAAAVLMTGTAFAAAYQAGVLDIFFRGDTSSLESYRTIQTTEDENYRLTVDSLRDGDGLYLYLTPSRPLRPFRKLNGHQVPLTLPPA